MIAGRHFLLALSASALALAACTPDRVISPVDSSDLGQALAVVTADDFAAKLGALAHDSTLGRLAGTAENEKAANWVMQQLTAAGLHPIKQTFMLNGEPVSNVIASYPAGDGTIADEAVLVTSHLDHLGTLGRGLKCLNSSALPADTICNGADDNASGTVGVIEAARVILALRAHPARMIVFIAFNAEEQGLIGSQYYVQHPTVLLSKIVAVVNLDMIARHPADTARVVGLTLTSLGDVVEQAALHHQELKLKPVGTTLGWTQSDHYPFARAGIPALFFCSGAHGDLHTTADNPDRANADQAARIAKLAALTAIDVANTWARPTWR